MALSDVTAKAVERAMAEFDQLERDTFLSKYGFGKARGYFLIHRGKRYDSKAIVGVAHSCDRPDWGLLEKDQFSGGDRTVAHHLESLGFIVERPTDDRSWTEEQLILTLDCYLHFGRLNASHEAVITLSDFLNDLTLQSEGPSSKRFRNPNAVAFKLGNFASIDPNHAGRGMDRYSENDKVIWNQYSSDRDKLSSTAAAIRSGGKLPESSESETEEPSITNVNVEEQHVEQFLVSASDKTTFAYRREQRLVLAFKNHLEEQGHTVTRHKYSPTRTALRYFAIWWM